MEIHYYGTIELQKYFRYNYHLDLKPLDALHIACAIALQCNYFLTVDKGILKKAALIKTILIMNPIDFIIEREVIQ